MDLLLRATRKKRTAEGRQGMGLGSGNDNLREVCVLIKEHFGGHGGDQTV